MTDILIPLETANRELIYKVYLCNHLVLKGYRCYLGRKSYINYLVKNLKEYIYIDKGYHKGVSEKIYEAVKINDGIIINLDEEGALDLSNYSVLMGRYSKTLFDNADLTFLWGNEQYELLKKNMNKKNKVFVTGHPRFELLKPKFKFLYQDEVNKIKNKYRDFILINTNMGSGNNIRGDEFVESNYKSRIKNINQIITFDKKKLEAYRSLIINLSQHFDKMIVLRPHPEEDHAFYLDAFKDIKNIIVVYDGSVVPWILAADIMIHPDCTTAIEALFTGKKSISYLPYNYPKDLVIPLALEASECFTSESKLISFLKDKIHSLENVDLENYPFADENFSISEETTNLIVNEINQLKNIQSRQIDKKLTIKKRAYLLYMYIRSKQKIFNSNKLIENKLKGFNSNSVRALNKTIIKHNNQFSAVKCRTINNNLYLYQ
jgi:surface carbohydrate biosynthesis protein